MSGLGWPQWALIVLICIEFGVVWEAHGKPRAPYNLGMYVLSMVLFLGLLVAGGFFTGGVR